jgi:hypothetical protein
MEKSINFTQYMESADIIIIATLEPILSQLNPVYNLTYSLFTINFLLIFRMLKKYKEDYEIALLFVCLCVTLSAVLN